MKIKSTKLLMPIVASLTLSGCSLLTKVGDFFNNLFGEEAPQGITTLSKTSGYYKDYDLDLTGPSLEYELQKMCFEKHRNYVLYSQYNSYCATQGTRNSIEAIADGSSINQYFYTGKEAASYGTREHVWPCANSAELWTHDGSSKWHVHNVDHNDYVGGGSDLFHVRTATSSINTKRGNSKFVDFDDPEFAAIKNSAVSKGETNGKYQIKFYGLNSAGQYADKCEPADEMKGDVARIITYVWIHYGDHGYKPTGDAYKNTKNGHTILKSDVIGSLSLQNIFGYPTLERCIETISAWNKIDPPSNVEKLRNNTVQGIQGNRNMFVDFPELIDELFDDYL